MLHVQHLLGVGHQRRMAAIARAFCERGWSVCYVSGGFAVPDLDIGGAELVQLPPVRASDAAYHCLIGERGEPIGDAWRAARTWQLLEAFARVRPMALLIESYPFARRMFAFELRPLLDAAHRARPRPVVISSVRDILEPKRKPGRNELIVEEVKRYFDRVLVHGDPDLVPLSASFALAAQIAPELEYTGYIVEPTRRAAADEGRPGEVLVSAGGGPVGERLLRTAIEAAGQCRHLGLSWRCLVGLALPESVLGGLRAAAPPGVVVERNRPDFPDLLGNCAVSVSQAGYNTALEALCSGARMVLVPFAEGGEEEQTIRARVLAERGHAVVIPEPDLDPLALATALERLMSQDRPRPVALRRDGARASVDIVARLVGASSQDGGGLGPDENAPPPG